MGKPDNLQDFTALLDAVEAKRELVLRMTALTVDIGHLLESEDFEGLEAVLETRQHLMAQFDDLSHRVELGYLELRSSLSADGGRMFGTREGEISGLMGALRDADKRVHASLQNALQQVKQQSEELSVQRRGLVAYAESEQLVSGVLVCEKK